MVGHRPNTKRYRHDTKRRKECIEMKVAGMYIYTGALKVGRDC